MSLLGMEAIEVFLSFSRTGLSLASLSLAESVAGCSDRLCVFEGSEASPGCGMPFSVAALSCCGVISVVMIDM